MDAVLFIGLQGAGKSTFYVERFFHTHVRISLDMLRTRKREDTLLAACLEDGINFVVDKMNQTRKHRARYIAPARARGFGVSGYYFDVPLADALARNRARAEPHRVPDVALRAAFKQLEAPSLDEGFDALFRVRVVPPRLDVSPL